jgi:hypothetical protein
MKILVTLRSLDQLPYYETVLDSLIKQGHHVKLAVSPGLPPTQYSPSLPASLEYLGEFSVRTHFVRWASLVREITSYLSYVNRWGQSEYYTRRWLDYLPGKLSWAEKRFGFVSLLAKLPGVSQLFRGLVNSIPPSQVTLRWLKSQSPDLIVVIPANLRFSTEIDYILAAKSLAIPSVSIVLSWDNLTTKGLFYHRPDVLITWSESQTQDAIAIHGFQPSQVIVAGAPFFDKWFLSVAPLTVEDYLPQTGLVATKPYILYLGSSENIAKDETPLVLALLNEMRQTFGDTVQLLVRPHPAHSKIYQSLPESPLMAVHPQSGQLPSSEESIQTFASAIGHALLVVGINTSGMIDALICDKPTVALVTADYQETQTQAVHFQNIAPYLIQTHHPSDVVGIAQAILAGDDPQHAQRQAFIQRYIRPRGNAHSAGEIAATIITNFAAGQSLATIEQSLSGTPHES